MLTIHSDLVQGTDEWHQARCGIVTASVAGKLLTPTLKVADNETARGLILTLTAERLTGYVEDTAWSADMWRGVEDEPIARDLYAEHHAPVDEVGLMVRDDWGYRIGYSPDGLVSDDGQIEIKSRLQRLHLRTILEDRVPGEYLAQIQCGLLVSGRAWCDFVSYCGGMPLYVKRVYPDPMWHEAIVAAVANLEAAAELTAARYHALTAGLPATERVERDAEIEF